MTDVVEEFVPTDLGVAMGDEAPAPEPVVEVAEEAPEVVEVAEEPAVEEVADEAPEPVEAPVDQTVPLAALKAEREQRQELQRQLDAQQMEPVEKPDFFDNPDAAMDNLKNEMRMESDTKMLEMQMELVKQNVGAESYESTIEIFNNAAALNPALITEIQNSKFPVQAAYDMGKKLEVMEGMSNDPVAWKAKVEADALEKARAEVATERATATAEKQAEADKVKAALPVDLANENSSGTRGNGFTGPTPLDNIL